MNTKICQYCGKEWTKTYLTSRSTFAKQKYCSRLCADKRHNKGKNIKKCLICTKEFIRKGRRNLNWWANAKYCSQDCSAKARIGKSGYWLGKVSHFKGRKHTLEAKEKNRLAHLGKSPTNKGIKRLDIRGEKHWNWQGGKYNNRHKLNTVEYKQWVSDVFFRDNWTCQTCGIRGTYLQAHHIKSWAHYPDLRFDVNNGVTLCVSCHKLTDNYKGRNIKNLER